MARLAASLAAVAVAVLALASCAASQRAHAPAPAPGPAGPDCSSAVSSLIGCATYVMPGSTQSKPPKECCDGVKNAIKSPAAVQCLCAALGKDYGIPINMTRAAGLPAACGGNPAAFSKCNIKLPGGAPTEAPAPSSGSTPVASSPSPSKSAATRSPISAMAVVAAVAAPLLSYYYL
ncbi:hypothetical protein EJB05_11114 [Eragrostis curvula]|uniref:Bifunctional inhibitor/plant lipid transfer protein/seed storage helical domain-containing protein n=1 Tax=Eragrostis curvula TaxID=38414 RepID=A0A5J9VNH3_9POAL|nr:hypothetical protein EJB05_11102 [Eragrostis curvula]TVU37779.1 hypothetical protein EJB05_11114 [Eragrostis curvula]